MFQGGFKPDVTFFGFSLTAEEARGAVDEQGKPADSGNPGWFFMIQQQPTEPRFGLDAATADTIGRKPADLTDWNQASWGDLVQNENALQKLTHAKIAGPLKGHTINKIEWGFNQAHMALITLQRPVRIGDSALMVAQRPKTNP